MCLRQRDSYSNSVYFSRNHMQRLLLSHPCGKCAECKQMKRNEWYMRNYWQARQVFDNGLYMVFETLTFDDEFLPRVSQFFKLDKGETDFSCVDKEGVQKFLKRLRRNLEKVYGKGSVVFKYFIVSEYGHDDTYVDDYGHTRQGTVRPHYHCIFYVLRAPSGLTPDVFVQMVHYAWAQGNTDNYKTFKVRSPHFGKCFANNVFGKYSNRSAELDLRRITNYVSKYVMKNDDYDALLGARAARVARTLVKDSEKEAYKEAFKQVKKKIGLFHLQSAHFGEYLLSDAVLDDDVLAEIESEGTVMMKDEQKVVVHVPLPMYYIRKLFYRYRTEKQSDGTYRVQWYLNDYGKRQMKGLTYRKIERLAKKYADYYANMDSAMREQVDTLLGDRTFHDLATYVLVYRGRIVYSGYSETDSLPSVEDIIDISNEYNAFDAGMHDYENCGQYLVSHEEIDLRPVFDGDDLDTYHRVEKKFRFVRRWCINEDTLFDSRRPWRGFDSLVSLFADFRAPRDDEKQRLFDKKVYLENKYKAIGLKVYFRH